MKNKRKFVFKNRIKFFLTEPSDFLKNRIKEDEGHPKIQEIIEKWQEDQQNLQNPEELGDFS